MGPLGSGSPPAGTASEASSPTEKISLALRVAATVLRTVFIGLVVLITFIVSMPQNETIWTVYDTPLDVVRLLLGLAVCIWLAVQLFKGPIDAHGYRTWLYLGLVAIPFAVICLLAIW
jgi:FtsH-binding integral membrane protein